MLCITCRYFYVFSCIYLIMFISDRAIIRGEIRDRILLIILYMSCNIENIEMHTCIKCVHISGYTLCGIKL